MIGAQIALRTAIQECLSGYQLRNPAFSVRALSHRLGTTPATLSRFLSGKLGVSRTLGLKIIEKLNLDPERFQELKDLFSAPKSEPSSNVSQLSMDQFHVISDWYYFAIRALLRTKNSKSSPKWIARRLGISESEVSGALEHLLRLEMLEQDPDGTLKVTDFQLHTPDGVADPFIRRNHVQHLELARKSLDLDAVELRDFTNLTFAVDAKRLNEAKAAIRRFRKEMADIFGYGEKQEVYKFVVQLFPVSRTDSMGEKK